LLGIDQFAAPGAMGQLVEGQVGGGAGYFS
jgi:hypothetical protein